MDSLSRYRRFRLSLPAANYNRPPKREKVLLLLKLGAAIAALFVLAWIVHQW